MKALLVSFALCVSAQAVAAETVLVVVSADATCPAETPGLFLSAVEDGAMAVFFHGGHIVFNDGVWNTDHPADASQVPERSLKVAAEGGASRVLALTLLCAADERGRVVPVGLRYSFFRVDGRLLIDSGTLSAELFRHRDQTPEELCARLGRAAGERALMNIAK